MLLLRFQFFKIIFLWFFFSWCWYFCCVRCLAHDKILDSWFSRGFLGFPCFTWEFLFFCWKKTKKHPSKSWFFAGNPKKNLVILVFLLEIQEFPSKIKKTKKTSRKPRIQESKIFMEMSGPRQNLGFLVFSRFFGFSLFYLGILGFLLEIQKTPSNSWFFAGNPNKP